MLSVRKFLETLIIFARGRWVKWNFRNAVILNVNYRNTAFRIFMAILSGVFVGIFAWMFMGLWGYVFFLILKDISITNRIFASPVNWPLVPGYKLVGGVIDVAYPLAAGVTTTALLWSGRPNMWRRLIVYLFLMVIIAPMSWVNYAMSDQWLNIWVQAGLNIIISVFFLTVVNLFRSVRLASADVIAIQSISVLMLTSFGVFLPLFYTSVFLAYAVGAINHSQVLAISDRAPLLFVGGAGAVVTFLNQLDRMRKEPATLSNARRSAPH